VDHNDTNTFWKLFCWTNVSPTDEKIFKATSLGPFVFSMAGQSTKITHCQIAGIDPAYNTPRPLRRGGFVSPNSPATGTIRFSQQSSSVSADDEIPFGKGPEGNFWLVVEIRIPGTNAPPASPPAAGSPPAR
jgi:hypothetical protein